MNLVEVWLRIDPQTKPRVYAQVYESADISSVTYWLEIVFSASIATFGLVLNSPAVIIGAMLISPLMGPIMATGLAVAAGDLYLAIKAVSSLVASIAVAMSLSAFFVWLLPFHSLTSEIIARTSPNLLDLGVALFSGLAGSVVVTRGGGGGGVTALPGVAIAVALMPPLCTMGFGLGSGANTQIMGGAGLLFLTNLVAITTTAFFVFLLVGMNAPGIRSADQSRMRDPLAQWFDRGAFSRFFADVGGLRWRVLLLVVLLGSVAVPLRRALSQVAGEAIARGVAQDTVRKLVPSGALVSQQLEVGRESVAVRLVATKPVPEAKRLAAEREIERRSGRKAELSVQSVASQSEVAELMQRLLARPQPAPPPPPVEKSLSAIQRELVDKIRPALETVWPSDVPMQAFELAFGSNGMVLDVHYQSRRDFDPVAADVLKRSLQSSLKAPDLQLKLERISMPTGKSPAPKR